MPCTIFQNILVSFLLLVAVRTAYSDYTPGKKTHMHFFFHEILSRPNATTANVVKSVKSNSYFDVVGVIDVMLREGADPNSKLIGRAQGLIVGSSMEQDNGILTTINFVFTDGPYNGSTLAICGRVVLGTVIERPIVGGTGQFRMARGYTISKQLNAPNGTLNLEVDASVWHY